MNYEHLEDVPGIEKIIPERYVWHLASPENRASILDVGLQIDLSEHNCIFANNQSANIKFMYPFCLETFDGRYNSDNLLKYDYWRIDTESFNADWYIDPNMKDGPKEYMGDDKYFVATETPIPCAAIELFEVGQEFIDIEQYVHITLIDKSTGDKELVIIHSIDNNYIKKEKSDIRKTKKILNSETSRFSYVKDVPFPLAKVQK